MLDFGILKPEPKPATTPRGTIASMVDHLVKVEETPPLKPVEEKSDGIK